MQRIITIPNIVYFSCAVLFTTWVLLTGRNIVHMDMMFIINTKIKHLLEHNLHLEDFIYKSLFPSVTSIIFTFFNTLFFHLNTLIETGAGSFFLILLGYKYLSEINIFILNKRQNIYFALLVGFILFGLHKWEASFTSLFSFAAFFNLSIFFFNYFFIIKYTDDDLYIKKKYHIPFFLFSNLLVIAETSAYFYAYILSIIVLLFFIRQFEIVKINRKRWNNILILNLLLLLLSFTITEYLSNYLTSKHNSDTSFQHYTLGFSIVDFFNAFLNKPFWFIEFYLIANSGAFLGEAYNYLELRALFGFVIMTAYGLAIYYVIKNKDKRLLVPVALILYNVFSCGFITMARYAFFVIEYGASSRYTAFNLSGVLGLVTILFFCILEERKKINQYISWCILIIIIVGYLYVDVSQLIISPDRRTAFKQMRRALFTGENIKILQADTSISLDAIKVLKKYHLNVYYRKIIKFKKTKLVSGTSYFNELEKNGFYENENGITWTNGNASIVLDNSLEIIDSLIIQLNTYMPPICKNINPKISLIGENNKEYTPVIIERVGDKFTYSFYFKESIALKKIIILSQTIDASRDVRVLSFPFVSLELKK